MLLLMSAKLVYGQQTDGEKDVAALKQKIAAYDHRFQQLNKVVDDLHWKENLREFAFMDKVWLTGPPPAVVKNKTGQGANNPLKIYAYVFMPKAIDKTKKYPLLVLPHDGVHGDFKTAYTHVVKELVAQGYVIVAPEYRGSSGYGEGFYKLIDYGGLEVADVKAGRDFMLANYRFIDEKRVGILGWSHGGYITLFNLFNYPDSYQVGFAGVPVSDLVARMGYKSQAYRDLYAVDYHLGKDANDNVAEYRKRSPAWNAQKLNTPLLIYANTNDEDVNVLEVEHLIQALKAEDKKFSFKIFEDMPGGHYFDRLDTDSARAIRLDIYTFLNQYLKPAKPFSSLDELVQASYWPGH